MKVDSTLSLSSITTLSLFLYQEFIELELFRDRVSKYYLRGFRSLAESYSCKYNKFSLPN